MIQGFTLLYPPHKIHLVIQPSVQLEGVISDSGPSTEFTIG